MTRQDDDRAGAKPYKTLQGRPRPAQLSRRRAGRRAAGARRARAADGRGPTAPPAVLRRAVATRRYRTLRPGAGERAQGRRGKAAAGAGAGAAPPAPLPLVARPRRRCFVAARHRRRRRHRPGLARATRSSTGPSTRPTSASTRRPAPQLTADDGWIWRNGTTVLLFGVDSKAGVPARSDTIMLMRFDPGDAHDQPALDPARHARRTSRRLRRRQDHAGHVARAARRSPSRPSRSSPASPSTTSWSWTSRASRGSSTPSAASTCTCPQTVITHGRRGGPPAASSPSRRACTTSTARTRCCTCASARLRRRRLHAGRAPAGVRAGAPEEDRPAVQHHQAARDRQAAS